MNIRSKAPIYLSEIGESQDQQDDLEMLTETVQGDCFFLLRGGTYVIPPPPR